MAATLSRKERLSGTTAVAELFSRGKSGSVGCIRYKFLFRDDDAPSRIVVSVPKRSFKRAVKRNLLKRRLRESYRLQKDILGPGYDILFIYTPREVSPFEVIFADMAQVLSRVNVTDMAQTLTNENVTDMAQALTNVAAAREVQGSDTQAFSEIAPGNLAGCDLDK